MRDKLSVKKNYLTLIAGLVWILAGSMVMSLQQTIRELAISSLYQFVHLKENVLLYS